MTLRDALAGHDGWKPPRAVWPRLVQLLRARRKRMGARPELLTGMAGVQAAMDRPLRRAADVTAVLLALRQVEGLDLEAAEDAAAEVDARLVEALCVVRAEPVAVTVTGWPPAFGPLEQEQLMGAPVGTAVAPSTAALLHQRLQGLALGGSTLQVHVPLGPDEVLPVPDRVERADLRRGRGDSWLPHVDAVGRFSATPEEIAARQAELLATVHEGLVIDPFCGCGGSAIALARAGLDVLAIERDPSRARLAGRNAKVLGVADRVTVRTGEALRLLPGLLRSHPGAAVFLDPPWGAAEGMERAALTWDTFVAPAVWSLVGDRRAVLAKLPRDFDLKTLPGPRAWTLRWEFGAATVGADRVVKLVTALRGPA